MLFCYNIVREAVYTVSQKTAPFYFCNNFVKLCSILIIFGSLVLQ